jgi:hypothetical protein
MILRPWTREETNLRQGGKRGLLACRMAISETGGAMPLLGELRGFLEVR